MELGSIGLGLLSDGLFCWPVPTEPMEFCIPPAGDPKRAIKRKDNRKLKIYKDNQKHDPKNQQNTHIIIWYVFVCQRTE